MTFREQTKTKQGKTKTMKATPFRYPLVPQDIPQGIKCAQRVQQYATQEPRFLYACPDSCWKEHCTAWERRRDELRGLGICPSCALEPFPFGHVIFSGKQGNYRLVELATTHEAIA